MQSNPVAHPRACFAAPSGVDPAYVRRTLPHTITTQCRRPLDNLASYGKSLKDQSNLNVQYDINGSLRIELTYSGPLSLSMDGRLFVPMYKVRLLLRSLIMLRKIVPTCTNKRPREKLLNYY